jgi:hypothetical protein
MPTRTIALTALIASCVSALVTLTVVLLVLAPTIRAASSAQDVQRVVPAEPVDLVDARGTVRARLEVDPTDGTGRSLRDDLGRSRMIALVHPSGGAGVAVVSPTNPLQRVFLGTSANETVGIYIIDETRQPIWHAP